MEKKVVLQAILGKFTEFTENLFIEIDRKEYKDKEELEREFNKIASSTIINYLDFETCTQEGCEVQVKAEDILDRHKSAFDELAK